jgi:hypothetical protein
MIATRDDSTLQVVPSGEMGIFHLTHNGQYVGTIAHDVDNMTTTKSWGWRLLAANGAQSEKDLAGSSADLDEALAAAQRAYRQSRQAPPAA